MMRSYKNIQTIKSYGMTGVLIAGDRGKLPVVANKVGCENRIKLV